MKAQVKPCSLHLVVLSCCFGIVICDVELFPIHRIDEPRVFQHMEKKAFVVLHRVLGILKSATCLGEAETGALNRWSKSHPECLDGKHIHVVVVLSFRAVIV